MHFAILVGVVLPQVVCDVAVIYCDRPHSNNNTSLFCVVWNDDISMLGSGQYHIVFTVGFRASTCSYKSLFCCDARSLSLVCCC